MNNDHKPCPFCGSKNLEIPPNAMYVECMKCDCFGPSANINPFTSMQREVVESLVWDKWDERQ
jgi:hypothetical protein